MRIERVSTALSSRRVASWVPVLVVVALTIGITVAAMKQPMLAAVALALPLIPLYQRYLPVVALLLLTSAPLLLSSFQVGPLTVDNYVTLLGLASAALWIVQQRRIRVPVAAALPLLLAVAIASSGALAGVDSVAGVIRYVGLAFVPVLIASGAVGRVAAERAIFLGLSVGALSVLTQPFISLVPVYVDPQTGAQRYGGLMGHPNFAAYALGLGILYLIGARRLAWTGWLIVAFFGVAILLTGSVGALGTVAAGIAVIVISRGVLRALGVVLAGAVGLVVLGGTIADRVGALVGGDPNLNSLNWRFQQWQSAIDLIGNRWWTGVGWQQIPLLIDNGLEAHSAYVELIVELGIVGCVLVGFGIVSLFMTAGPRLVALVMVAVVVTSSLTDPVIVYPSSMATLLTLLLCERLRRHEDGAASAPAPAEAMSRSTAPVLSAV